MIEGTTISRIIGSILGIEIIWGWIIRIQRWIVTLSNINRRWIIKALLKLFHVCLMCKQQCLYFSNRSGSNLLSIIEITGSYSFGRPSRITSRCSRGRTRSLHDPSASTMHLMCKRNSCIVFCISIIVLSSVRSILAFAHVCFWKYSCICSQS